MRLDSKILTHEVVLGESFKYLFERENEYFVEERNLII